MNNLQADNVQETVETTSKTFSVQVPFTGYITVEVQAVDYEDALEKGYEVATNELETMEDVVKKLGEFKFHEKIVQGNVFYGVLNEIDAVEV